MGYQKGEDRQGEFILCTHCQRKSYSAQDIAATYCGFCHRFHDDDLRAPGDPIERTEAQVAVEQEHARGPRPRPVVPFPLRLRRLK